MSLRLPILLAVPVVPHHLPLSEWGTVVLSPAAPCNRWGSVAFVDAGLLHQGCDEMLARFFTCQVQRLSGKCVRNMASASRMCFTIGMVCAQQKTQMAYHSDARNAYFALTTLLS